MSFSKNFKLSLFTKEEYLHLVNDFLDRGANMNEAIDLLSLGSSQSFAHDNDIFSAIQDYIGELETPLSQRNKKLVVKAIKDLINAYHKEKAG